MAVGAGQMSVTAERLAQKSRAYGKGEEGEITFNSDDRAVADEEGVKARNQ